MSGAGLKVDSNRGKPPASKLCDLCEGLEPESETHLLLLCAVEAGPRAELLSQLPGFAALDFEARLRTLFGVDTGTSRVHSDEREARRRRTLAFMRQALRRREEDRLGQRSIQRDVDILTNKYFASLAM